LPCLVAAFILKLEADGYLRHVTQGLTRSHDVEGEKTVDNEMNDEMNAWTAGKDTEEQNCEKEGIEEQVNKT
jgi:hypothetical protein